MSERALPERFATTPASGAPASIVAGETLVIVPHGGALTDGFARARASLDAGSRRARGTTLDEDVAASDIVIGPRSTAIYEVLFAGVPLFVHLGPEHVDAPAGDFVDPARAFFRAEELRAPLGALTDAPARGEADALAPEVAARRALFGPPGRPRRLVDVRFPAHEPA